VSWCLAFDLTDLLPCRCSRPIEPRFTLIFLADTSSGFGYNASGCIPRPVRLVAIVAPNLSCYVFAVPVAKGDFCVDLP
jgi:hypothetical protein